MLFFDAPNFFYDGHPIALESSISDRPKMNQISTCYFPHCYLNACDFAPVRGDIILAVYCEDGIVFVSILPNSSSKKTRD